MLKRLNKEQWTLVAAIALSGLLLAREGTRPAAVVGTAPLPSNERATAVPKDLPVEFADARPEAYLSGRNFWEPPQTGFLPVPELRPPAPRVEALALPPLRPGPEPRALNRASLPGKYRILPGKPASVAPTGLPPAADIAKLADLPEPEDTTPPDKRSLPMRPGGEWVVHRTLSRSPIKGRSIAELPDGSVHMEVRQGNAVQRLVVPPNDIDRFAPGTDDGIERGWEYEKEYRRRSAKLKEGDAEGRLKLARWCREEAGMRPEAVREARVALEALLQRNDLGTRARDALLFLVASLRHLGDYDAALGALHRFIDEVRGSSYETYEPHLRSGDLYQELGLFECAVARYTAAVHLEPAKQDPRIARARALYELGLDAEAQETVEGLVRMATGHLQPEGFQIQGLVSLRLGQAAAAEQAFTAAMAAKPRESEALNGLGVALALQNKPGAAQRFLDAIRADQYEISAWLNLATLYLAAGAPAEAEILYRGAAQRDPSSAEAAEGLGLIRILKGEGNEAAAHFAGTLKIQPDHFHVRYVQGHLLLKEGQPGKALEEFRSSIRAEPHYLPSYYGAAAAYLALAQDEQRAMNREQAFKDRTYAESLLKMILEEEPAFELEPGRFSAYTALACVYAVLPGRAADAHDAFRQGSMGGRWALVEYGRGYVDYGSGGESAKLRLQAAEIAFRQGAALSSNDPSDQAWVEACKEALRKIEAWLTTRVLFEDRFDGNRESPSAGWLKIELPNGPRIAFENDRAVLGGAQGRGMGGKITALERRDIPREQFLSVEATFHFERMDSLEAGLSVYTTKPVGSGRMETAGGVHLVFLEDRTAPGAVKPIRLFFGQELCKRDEGPRAVGTSLATRPAPPGVTRVKIERREDAATRSWIFHAYLWDDARGDWTLLTEKQPIRVLSGGEAAPFIVTLWGRSPYEGQSWSFGLDDVRVLVGGE